MSKVLLIAKRELQAYFSTWMGYIIAALALFINGILFKAYAMSPQAKLSSDVLTDFFYFNSGLAMVAAVFLAMRLLAEERQTGTLVLFFTSPVSERQLIYGKFLSAAVFLLFLQVLTLYIPALIFLEGKVSFGHMAAGYAGVMLIGMSILTVSLFASVISPNQLIAGILGAAFTVFLLIMWMLAAVVDQPFRDILNYGAIHQIHFPPFSRGLIHTQSILYYGTVILFFLECSIRSLESKRLQGL